ncbi:arylsulfatase [Rubritalea tangerina]|uniref:Arylsulfatase n=1 Tax=Rubritalea tangerina TaxID=430798 RepID=A0ABW4ZEB7_9BACT
MKPNIIFSLALSCFLAIPLHANSEQKPNIILIMLDDMGYSDLGCYGGEIETPNIDKLAANGTRFSQFYNAGRCCPTRASMLTGLYPHRSGVGHMASRDYGFKGYIGELRQETPTVAENLKAAGYDTWMAGKWHLSINFNHSGPKYNWPKQRGFDEFYGTLIAAGSQWDPITLTHGNDAAGPVPADQDYYYTEALTNKALTWMQNQKEKDTPFFLYMAYTAPHWPLHARQEVIEKYKKRYLAGYEAIRSARIKRLHSEGLLPNSATLTPPHPDITPWKDEPNREWQASRMAAYAAMIDQVDTSVGKLIEQLKADGELENTLILVLSDNGSSSLEHPNGKIGSTGAPWTTMRYVPVHTRDKRVVISGDVVGVEPGPEDTYGGCGVAWANVNNTPFRLFKRYAHEGGVCTPMIVHWPKQLPNKNAIVHTPAHVIDFLPTILDAAGTKHLSSRAGKPSLSLDGLSLLPLLKHQTPLPQRVIGFEHAGNKGLRSGDWKIVAENGKDWELYNLHNDRTEAQNLAQSHPEKLRELSTLYSQWASNNWVEDWKTVSASLHGKQAGAVVLPDAKNPLRRNPKETADSVKAINQERAKRGIPLLDDNSKPTNK